MPDTRITIDAANHVLYHVREGGYPPGGFITALLEAWDRADLDNSARLAIAFPAYGAALALYLRDPAGVQQLRIIANGGETDA